MNLLLANIIQDKLLHRAIRKYGFKDLKDTLNNLEKYYIVQYNCKVPNGYNVSDGGEGNLGIILREK